MTAFESATEKFTNFSAHNGSLFNITIMARCQLPFDMAVSMFVINVLVSFLGTAGNLLVCLAVLITPSLQRISNYFICCLAIADLTINAADQPLLSLMLWGRMYGICFPDIEFAFRVIGNVSCAASLLTLCFISIDRCVSITKPFSYLSIITKTKFFFMVLSAWTFSAVYTYLRLEVSKKITSYVTVGIFATGYTIFAACYLLIIVKIKQQSKERMNLVGHQRATQASQRVETRLAVTVALIIFVFTVAWTPLFYLRVTSPKKNYGVLYDWARTIALSSSAVNPALYCLRNEDYRKAFAKILRFVFCCRVGSKTYGLRSSTTTTPRTVSTRVAPQ